VWVIVLVLQVEGVGAQEDVDMGDLLEMSMTDLMDVTVVTASRRQERLLEAPSAVSIITREEILRSPAHTIPELLQYVVGMDGYTKTHTDHDVAARGLAYDETPKMLFLIDSQPVNVVPYGGIQWPTLPITKASIDRIEVVRGPSSALYGADAQAGVVNIITLPAGERQNSASVVYGDRGSRVYELEVVGAPTEGLGVSLTGSFTRTERKGDEEFAGASRVAPNFDIKDWADIYLVAYRLDYRNDVLTFLSEGGFTSDEEGYNASAGDASIDYSEKRTIYLNTQMKIPVGADEIGFRVGFRNLWQRNQRWTGNQYEFKYVLPKGRGLDVDVQYSVRPLRNHNIIFGASASRFRASRDIANDPPYVYDQSDNLWSAYAQDQISLANRRLLLTLSGRYEKWDSFDGPADQSVPMRILVVFAQPVAAHGDRGYLDASVAEWSVVHGCPWMRERMNRSGRAGGA
jgi:outer membrane cobalamin receptor